MTRRPIRPLLILGLLGPAAWSCMDRADGGESDDVAVHADGAAATMTASAGATAADSTPVPAPRSALLELPGALATVAAAPVVGRTGPGDVPFEVALRSEEARQAIARRFGTRTLDLGLRVGSAGLRQYPCSSCHLGERIVFQEERVDDAHEDIQPVHPAETGATCSSCHAAVDVERLALGSGDTVALDHAYRLCAECHSPQVTAWAAGAHGKRLDGWRGRRVVMGCAECHDPHRPALEQRIPFRAPTLPSGVRGDH